MDNLPNNQPAPQPPVQIGKIILILIAVAILLVILFDLNYFNILPISQKIPILSFLPHREPAIKERVKNDSQNLLNNVILTSLIPPNLVFDKQNVNNPNNYTFYGTGWTGNQGETFVITIEYNQRNELIDRQVAIHIPRTTTGLDESIAPIILRDYISIKSQSPLTCVKLPEEDFESMFCESFWQDETGLKKGISVTSPIKGLNETQLFYCEHYSDNPAYSWKSCNHSFKDQGVAF